MGKIKKKLTTILLDTNALIWLLSSPNGKPLGQQAKKVIRGADSVYVSAVSILEIQIKTMLGKLKSSITLLDDIESAGLKSVPFNMEHAEAISIFSNLSKHDPFDRMLLAQAKVEGFLFLTSDRLLLDQNIAFVINARD